jgi:asparagine synthase (glutamine-hydrolysing)
MYDIEGRLLTHRHDPRYRGPFGGRAFRTHYMSSTYSSVGGDLRAALRAHWGLEMRQPLADRRMIEFCLAIPQDQFLKNGEQRRLARQILRAAGAPVVIADNRRRGLQNPEWFSTMNRDACAAELERAARSSSTANLLDLERLRDLIDTWPADAEAAQRRYSEYATMLPRALHVASFIRWAEGDNN